MSDTARHTVPLPRRMAGLPRDHRGYVVPWFVTWEGDVPQFPIVDPKRWTRAMRNKLCWVCGQPLGRVALFVLGPMCCVNRISAEPPTHRECATYSALVCPYLCSPRMGRVPLEKVTGGPTIAPGGIMSLDNPGTCALWPTRNWHSMATMSGPLVKFGEPVERVEWYAHGRVATDTEAADSFRKGCGRLLAVAAAQDERAVVDLVQLIAKARHHLPDPELVRELVEEF
jgi:hypothetical protein